MATDAAAVLDFAATLPETGEREWSDRATMITFRGRGIAWVTTDGSTLVVKSTIAEREAMLRSDPDAFAPSWASGRFAWVEVDLRRVEPDEACELVLDAWRLTAPKRVVRGHDATLA